ncbi:MAG: penicillin-binding protein 2 [Deltaproteobacteria bacterium]|nr:penicillin-binding protein 2 [Deltaproteobacteria bacterium]MBW2069376.1 penicillin-binding protein 2 [Deltaproteobacteria bacterium]
MASKYVVLRNVYFIIGCCVAAIFLYIGKLYYYQVVKGEQFREQSENNRTRLEEIPSPRGIIYDRYGRVLVDNRPAFHIYLVREDINVPVIVKRVAHLCSVNFEDLMEEVKRQSNIPRCNPVRLITDVDRDCVAKVEAHLHQLPGVFVSVEPVRFYRFGKILAHTLGYLGEITEDELKRPEYREYKRGSWIGKTGLEKVLEQELKGVDGIRVVEVDALGRRLRTLEEKAPIPGRAVWLTLDVELQRVAAEALQGVEGAIVAMDVKTGAIRALVSNPSYDPNAFIKGLSAKEWNELNKNPDHPLVNRAIQAAYPPGSTFKPFVAMAALESGVSSYKDTAFCPGFYRLGRRSYRCWKRGGHGWVDMYRAIVESCDVYFYQLGLKLGVDRIAEYARLFGFGDYTGIELPGERKGLIPTSKWKEKHLKEPWQKGETLSVAIGQGYVLVTPIQLAVAYAAIANNGRRLVPYIVDRVEGKGFYRITRNTEAKRLPLSKSNISFIKKALLGVVKELKGTAHGIWDETLPIAGKTGTAQVIRLSDRTRGENIPKHLRDHAWFIGYAPAHDPEIVVVAIVEHGGHGSSAAAPIVKKVIDFYFMEK